MAAKRKLIQDFAVDCFYIIVCCAALLRHDGLLLVMIIGSYSVVRRFLFSREKPNWKKYDRELTTVEAVAWFAILFSFLWISFLIISKGFLNHAAFVIPVFVIIFAGRLLQFAKGWMVLKNSASVSK